MLSSKYTSFFYIKLGLVTSFLFFESFLLTTEIYKFVISGDFFSTNFSQFFSIVALMSALVLTIPLSIGAWNKSTEYLAVPIPLALGNLLALININPTYLLLIIIAMFLLFVGFLIPAVSTKDSLIKFNVYLIFSRTIKGVLFTYAILGGSLLFMSSKKGEDFNLVERIGHVISDQVYKFIEPTIDNNIVTSTISDIVSKLNLNNEVEINEEVNVQNNSNDKFINNLALEFKTPDPKPLIQESITKALLPYNSFILPIVSVLVFGLLQFLGTIASFVFAVLEKPIFYFAKRTNFLVVNHIQVEQEQISY